ncbi:hypothetical protein E5288_WYG021298 [Bos mutus]|uniref:Uncharacterized protein n=1 Tax=Bos mutus TaxID=72004 RepID=A0A6B0RFX5_9CETA|nr:hypothetical protein [Bos mutus]
MRFHCRNKRADNMFDTKPTLSAPLTCESRHSSPLVLTGEGGRLTHAAVDLLCAFHLENSYNGVHCGASVHPASVSLLESDAGKGIEHGPRAALMCSFRTMYMKTRPLGLCGVTGEPLDLTVLTLSLWKKPKPLESQPIITMHRS